MDERGHFLNIADFPSKFLRCFPQTVIEFLLQLERSYFIRTDFSLRSQKVKVGRGGGSGREIGKKEEQGRSRVVSEQIRWEKTQIRAAFMLYPGEGLCSFKVYGGTQDGAES